MMLTKRKTNKELGFFPQRRLSKPSADGSENRKTFTNRDLLFQMTIRTAVSKSLYVIAKLGLANLMANVCRTVSDLASATSTAPHALYRFLRALNVVDQSSIDNSSCFD